MVELEAFEAESTGCCSHEVKETCCEPEAKEACCGQRDGGCGCGADTGAEALKAARLEE